MKPRRTPTSNTIFHLEGGTEDNDLWVEATEDQGGNTVLLSTWELTSDEREAVANGANIELAVWGAQPPVSVAITQTRLGKG